jgi:hypothetical protein
MSMLSKIIPVGALTPKVTALFIAGGLVVGGGATYALTSSPQTSTPAGGFVVDPIFGPSPGPQTTAEANVQDEVIHERTVEQAPSQPQTRTNLQNHDGSDPASNYNACADPNSSVYYTETCGHVVTGGGHTDGTTYTDGSGHTDGSSTDGSSETGGGETSGGDMSCHPDDPGC